MINSLRLKLIQGHEDTNLKLHPGVNVIKGTSNAGKSSIIRGIRWGLENRPRGDVLRSDFSTDPSESSEVDIEFDKGWVRRRKNKGQVNEYRIGSPDIGELTLRALRSDVPDEVRHISHLSEVNLQTQHDTYFLLQDSPGIVAKKLNDIVGLGIINEVTGKVNSMLTELNILLKTRKEDAKDYQEKLKKYHNLPKIESYIRRLDKLIEKDRQLSTGVERVQHVLNEIKVAEETVEGLSDWLTIKEKVEGLKDKAAEARNLTEKRSLIISLCQSVDAAERKREKAGKSLLSLRRQHSLMLKSMKICPFCGSKLLRK